MPLASSLLAAPSRAALRVAPRRAPRASRAVAPRARAVGETAPDVLDGASRLDAIVADIAARDSAPAKLGALLACAAELPPLPASERTPANRVQGCAAEAWIELALDPDDPSRVRIRGHSDAQITAGFAGVLARGLDGCDLSAVADVSPEIVRRLGVAGADLPRSRANGFRNMLETVKRQARTLRLEEAIGADSDSSSPSAARPFPSLIVTSKGVEAVGAFAENQRRFIEPDASRVAELVSVLEEKKIGIVAHFYMDAEVQGVLTAAQASYPHVFISDSLVMADAAVKMADAGCETVLVLGVDFMSENVRAILDDAGKTSTKVFRMAAEDIGCSLAEAAQSDKYEEYLKEASGVDKALHVIYINTALDTKADADAIVPTITCTSSNVVQTVLQADAQIPGVEIFYGPDTYMGGNLAKLFTMMSTWPDEDVRAVHPAHTAETVRSLLPRLRYFQDGTCVIHHMFGGDVTATTERCYGDAYLTAHFEVPGEMFGLAMRAKRERDMGVVGSTKNILDFVVARVREAVERRAPSGERMSFVLGTETGMVTSIVKAAGDVLAEAEKADGACGVECEIVFPVSLDSVTRLEDGAGAEAAGGALGDLRIVPGPAAGEGCSSDGGCASCPYMKMNSLDALLRVAGLIGTEAGEAMLAAHAPRTYAGAAEGEASVAARGCVPILHMRDFQRDGAFSERFAEDVRTRAAKARGE